jgi:hypothetical protein
MFILVVIKDIAHFVNRFNNHATHTSNCPDCINMIRTLDEIGQNIEKNSGMDLRNETEFDFKNVSENIIKWSRQNLRAVRKDTEEKFIITPMDEDEAFCTFRLGSKDIASRIP